MPSHWRPARVASPADSLFPRKPSPISAREERWRLSGLSGLDGLDGLDELYGLYGSGRTGRIWGVRVGCRSIDRLLCSHSPGAAEHAPCLDRTCQIMGMTRRSQHPMAPPHPPCWVHLPSGCALRRGLFHRSAMADGRTGVGVAGAEKEQIWSPFRGLAILG